MSKEESERLVKAVEQEAMDESTRFAKHIADLYAKGQGSTWYSEQRLNDVATTTAKDIAFSLSCLEAGETWT